MAICADLGWDDDKMATAVALHVSRSWAHHLKRWAVANAEYVKQINFKGGHHRMNKVLDMVAAKHLSEIEADVVRALSSVAGKSEGV